MLSQNYNAKNISREIFLFFSSFFFSQPWVLCICINFMGKSNIGRCNLYHEVEIKIMKRNRLNQIELVSIFGGSQAFYAVVSVSATYQMPLQCDIFSDRKLILLPISSRWLCKSCVHNASFILFRRLKYMRFS